MDTGLAQGGGGGETRAPRGSKNSYLCEQRSLSNAHVHRDPFEAIPQVVAQRLGHDGELRSDVDGMHEQEAADRSPGTDRRRCVFPRQVAHEDLEILGQMEGDGGDEIVDEAGGILVLATMLVGCVVGEQVGQLEDEVDE